MSRTWNQIIAWRRVFPKMECIAGCRSCCENYAPSMTKEEWLNIKHPGKISPGKTLSECPFLGPKGCQIYSSRPMICRLFGTVEKAPADQLGMFKADCPKGQAPATPLDMKTALLVQVAYEDRLWARAKQLIIEFIAALKGGLDPVQGLPAKFEYLRYLLSTQDGQKGLAISMGLDDGHLTAEQYAQVRAIMGEG